jgi:hypothetical protein
MNTTSSVIQTQCCCGKMHPNICPESTKHKCTMTGLKVFAVFCLNLEDYEGHETSSTSAPCKKCPEL